MVTRICNLSGNNTSWREPHGEAQERTEWHRVTVKSSNLVVICERKAQRSNFLKAQWKPEAGLTAWKQAMEHGRILRPFRSELKVVANPKATRGITAS